MKHLLKPHSLEDDNCMVAILEWLDGRGRINKAELVLQKFRYWKKGRREWCTFSAETIGRKARKLAELGIIERHESNHQTWYALPSEARIEPKKPVQMEMVEINGVRMMRSV